MTKEGDNFFQEQKDWSKRKLIIIKGYLEIFSKILGSSTNQSCVYFVDGFAGAGQYEKDGSKGSPLLSAELAQEYLVNKKPYRLKCINIEEDETNYSNLISVTAKFGDLVQNFHGLFSENLDTVLSLVNKCPALFFIDPFGVKGPDWNHIKRIVHRDAPTDIWLRFDHRTVRRLSGFFDSGSSVVGSKFNNLLRLYGLNRADNLNELLQGETSDERINKALNLYVGRIEKEFLEARGFGYSVAIPIISLRGERKYHLIFAAGHLKAAIVASQIAYTAERNRLLEKEEFNQKMSGQPSLIPLEPKEQDLSAFMAGQLATEISHICGGRRISRQDIYLKLISVSNKKWFGRFSSSHFNMALALLQKGENPVITDKTGINSDDKTTFTLRSLR